MKLTGLNAVITGASQGLGLEIARRFVREGASVAICSRGEGSLAAAAAELRALASADQKIFAMACDVSDRIAVGTFFATATQQLKSIHVLVNNAGVYGPKGPTESVDVDEWIHAVEVNLYGVLHACRAVIPQLKAQGRGKIINLSGGGATAPMPLISAYAASKAAVVRLTETLGEELRPWRIDVNAVAPGALNTRLLDEILAAGPAKVGEKFYERALKQKSTGGAPMGLGADLCIWLASSAGDGITGKLLSAQWDQWAELPSKRAALEKSDIFTLRRIVPADRGETWT